MSKLTSREQRKLQEYLSESSKTLSGKFYYDNLESEPDVYHFCNQAIKACNDLDLVKKKKFYNKDVNISSSAPADIKFEKENNGENTLHAAIGLTTECGEILEAVIKHKYSGTPIDVVNIKEEIGDLMWYMAILLRDYNIDLFDVMETNINKLRARYGESFSTDKANNRNLSNERAVLERARELENGGMAPPKPWTSITGIKFSESEKESLVNELRKLKERGETVSKSNFHHKNPITIEEFTQPFSFLEDIRDYNGSFLITVLKSEEDFKKQESDFGNMDYPIALCKSGDLIALQVFDIAGSTSIGEEKKFIALLNFDKINGSLSFNKTLSKSHSITPRQQHELSRFCKIKKITQ